MNRVTKSAIGVALFLGSKGALAACGDIQIAEWNWASGELMANVDKIILEAGYDCNVEMDYHLRFHERKRSARYCR